MRPANLLCARRTRSLYFGHELPTIAFFFFQSSHNPQCQPYANSTVLLLLSHRTNSYKIKFIKAQTSLGEGRGKCSKKCSESFKPASLSPRPSGPSTSDSLISRPPVYSHAHPGGASNHSIGMFGSNELSGRLTCFVMQASKWLSTRWHLSVRRRIYNSRYARTVDRYSVPTIPEHRRSPTQNAFEPFLLFLNKPLAKQIFVR
jgi:hypothetical protein